MQSWQDAPSQHCAVNGQALCLTERLMPGPAGLFMPCAKTTSLFDAASSPCISPKQLGDAFCVAASTGAAKAKIVRDALGMGPFEHRWLLEGNAANNPALWMIFVDGFAMDVRNASRATPNRWHDCRRKFRKCGS